MAVEVSMGRLQQLFGASVPGGDTLTIVDGGEVEDDVYLIIDGGDMSADPSSIVDGGEVVV